MQFYSEDSIVKVPDFRLVNDYERSDGTHLDFLVTSYAGETLEKRLRDDYETITALKEEIEHTVLSGKSKRKKQELEEKVYGYLEEALEMLAYIHAKPRDDKPIGESKLDGIAREEEEFYTGRALNTAGFAQLNEYFELEDSLDDLISAEEQQQFKEDHEKVEQLLRESAYAWYKDANVRNWAIDEFDNVTAFDFEGKRYAPVVMDLIHLIEFGGEYVEPEEKEKLLFHYIDRFEHYTHELGKGIFINRKAFTYQYEAARLQRHLELANYRARDATKTVARENDGVLDYRLVKDNIDYRLMKGDLELAKDAATKIYSDKKGKEAQVISLIDRVEQRIERKVGSFPPQHFYRSQYCFLLGGYI